jgi:hypothetical protein
VATHREPIRLDPICHTAKKGDTERAVPQRPSRLDLGIHVAKQAVDWSRTGRGHIRRIIMKLVAIIASSLLLASACGGSQEEPKTPAEEAVDNAEAETEEAVEEAGEELEEAGDDAEEATED